MPAPGLQMIREAIYSLKQEYGLKVLIVNSSSTLNTGTGKRTTTYSSIVVPKAILLPQTMMFSLAKIFNLAPMGAVEKDTRTLLIDKRDLTLFSVSTDSFVGYDGSGISWRDLSTVDWNNLEVWNKANNAKVRRQDIVKVEDSLYAVALSVIGLNAVSLP